MTDKPAAETITMDFSHDYPNDTHLTCSKEGDLVHLLLAFDSEDPDMGTEEMEYNSDGGESFSEIIHDALSDLSSYLDRQDTSSFFEQQGELLRDGIHDEDDYFGEFSRTSLYAFEGALKAAESNQLLRQDSQKKAPAIPSSIKLKAYSGYRKNIFEGWKKLEDSTITGEGYKVEFYRLSERTIDRMCDALNGWYNVWTKFRCDYEDTKGTLSIVVRKPEEADKIFKIMSDIQPLSFEHEGTISVPDVARLKMESIIDLHMTAEQEKPSVLSELKRLSCNSPHGKNTPKEMEI